MHKSITTETALVALALLNYADDEGRFKFDPQEIRHRLFPHREGINIEGACVDLSGPAADWLILYEAEDNEGKIGRYGMVKNFLVHQTVCRPIPSRLPPPPHMARTKGPRLSDKGRCQHYINIWNKTAEKYGLELVEAESRQAHAIALHMANSWEDGSIEAVSEEIGKSKFLQGKKGNKDGWKCTFWWLGKRENFAKVMIGQYRDTLKDERRRLKLDYLREDKKTGKYSGQCDYCASRHTTMANPDASGDAIVRICPCGKTMKLFLEESHDQVGDQGQDEVSGPGCASSRSQDVSARQVQPPF